MDEIKEETDEINQWINHMLSTTQNRTKQYKNQSNQWNIQPTVSFSQYFNVSNAGGDGNSGENASFFFFFVF